MENLNTLLCNWYKADTMAELSLTTLTSSIKIEFPSAEVFDEYKDEMRQSILYGVYPEFVGRYEEAEAVRGKHGIAKDVFDLRRERKSIIQKIDYKIDKLRQIIYGKSKKEPKTPKTTNEPECFFCNHCLNEIDQVIVQNIRKSSAKKEAKPEEYDEFGVSKEGNC